jgi:hypothetical protein
VQIVYLGFDTEFNKIELDKNRLVYAKLAVSSKIFLRVAYSTAI